MGSPWSCEAVEVYPGDLNADPGNISQSCSFESLLCTCEGSLWTLVTKKLFQNMDLTMPLMHGIF
jgi:hypothetical protein